jgi:protein-S-isoprenylcysteine O-methyltransferase Ste14
MSIREAIIYFINKTATGPRRLKVLLTPVGGLFFLSLVGLNILFALLADRYLGFPVMFTPPSRVILSVPVLTAGMALWFWSVRQFVRARGTPVPFNPPPKLIQDGPYAYVRNPMLTAVFFLLFGFGILLGSISLTFLFTPLFVAASAMEFKFIEEPELELRFGSDYIQYKNRVPMFIPKIKGRKKAEK